jgi:hypothetical protein
VSGASLTTPLVGLRPIDGEDLVVTVESHPGGFFCQVLGGSNVVIAGDRTTQIVCTAAATFPVQIDVAGLAGPGTFSCDSSTPTGVKLIASVGTESETLCVAQNGSVTTTLRGLPGVPFSVAVTGQPLSPPPRFCTLSNGSGVLTNGGVPSTSIPTVNCVQPNNVITGLVTGLTEPINLGLVTIGTGPSGTDQQITSIVVQPSGAIGPPPVNFDFAATPLMDNVTFQVTMLTIPAGYECVVEPGVLTTPLPIGVLVVVACTKIPAPVYFLSGTISGLTGDGLELGLNFGSETIDVAPGSTSFAFESGLGDNDAFKVTVEEAPDGQYCVVSNAEGSVDGAHPTGVTVVCHNLTTIRVVADAPTGYSSAKIKARIIRTGPNSELSAFLPGDDEGPSMAGGAVELSFVGIAPTDSLGDANPGATDVVFGPLLPGEYVLFMMLSNTKSTATGKYLFTATTALGAWVPFSIQSPSPVEKVVDIQASEFLPTREIVVTTTAIFPLIPLANGDETICAFSPSNASVPLPPFKDLAPVIGSSRYQCGSTDGCATLPGGTNETTNNDPMPFIATVDITCWADADDDQKNGDYDVLSIGDHFGRAENVSLPVLTPPLIVPLQFFNE